MTPHTLPRMLATIALLLATLGPATTLAQDGTPDPGFAFTMNGHFGAWFDYLPGGSVGETAQAVVVHEGGFITVVGHFQKPGSSDFDCAVLRTRPDASDYDTRFMPPLGYGPLSFNRGGNNDDVCHAMLALPADQLLIAGGSGVLAAGERAGTLIKLLADGGLDPAFFGDGVFDTLSDLGLSEPGAAITFEHLPPLSSGYILPAGNIVRGDLYSRAFVLRMSGGVVDPEFNGGAPLELGDSTLPSLILTGVAEDSQLRVHLLGTALDPLDVAGVPHHGLLLRLLPDGSLDPTFDGDGRLELPQCSGTGALSFDFVGILVGCAPPRGGPVGGVLRLLPNGSVDIGFGMGGHAEMRMESWDTSVGLGAGMGPPVALQVLDDGTIIGLGTYLVRSDIRPAQGLTDLAVARLLPDGQPDPSFGGSDRGTAHYRFGSLITADKRREAGTAMTLDEDGSLIVVGSRSRSTAVPDTAEFLVARLLNRGSAGSSVFSDGFE